MPSVTQTKAMLAAELISCQHRVDNLQAMLDEVGAYIFMKDKAGCFTYVNQNTQALFGTTIENIIGKTSRDFFEPVLLKKLEKNDYLVLACGETVEEEARITVAGSHDERIFRVIKKPLRNQQGQIVGLSGMATDITTPKHIEKLLDEQKAVLENKLVGVITVKNQKIVWANSAYEAMLGYGKGELVGLPLRQLFVNEQDYQTEGDAYANFKGATIVNAQHAFVRKDASHIWLDMSGTLLNKVIGESLWVFVDVNERQRAEDNLRIAATAFESHEGIMVTDHRNLILRVNRAFTDITGYNAEEVIGKNPSILHSGRQDKDFYKAMWQGIQLSGTWEGEIWNRRKNGEVYPEHLTVTAIKDQYDNITNYVASLSDITNSKLAADEIQQLAFYDCLTGLPNRRLLLDRLKQAFTSNTRSGKHGALLFADLDHFKMLNDTLGHVIGDELLQQVAVRLTSLIQQADTVARLSGDEFLIILEDLSQHDLEAASQAETTANKILETLNQPYQLKNQPYHTTCSIGITLFNAHHYGAEALIKQADIAMYQAKKEGRNKHRFFDKRMQEVINLRAVMENDLSNALHQQQFELFYQPQVNHANGVLGAEALIRWLHPERGLITPANFIPLAEETGLIIAIGEWALHQACSQLSRWQKASHTKQLTLSVNVSAKQFRQPDFIQQVKLAIDRYNINPKLLKLELTESILLESIEDTITSMHAFNAMGIHFALDDFGTGYSSLQYLKRLPLFQLKIDKSFVRDIVSDHDDQAIVQTIIAMANNLQLNVIAEGVETEQQKLLLLNKGCDTFQGYLFGKPVPIQQFNTALMNSQTQYK